MEEQPVDSIIEPQSEIINEQVDVVYEGEPIVEEHVQVVEESASVSEEPVYVEEATTEEPVHIEQPAPVEEHVSEEPVYIEEDAPVEERASVEEHVPVEEHVHIEEHVPVEEHVSEEPAPVEEPTPVVEEPATVEEPVHVEEPAPVSEEPAPIEEHTPVVEEPVYVEEPTPVVEEPVYVEEPAPEEPIHIETPVVEEPAPIVEETTLLLEEPVPKLIFLVPYRDRESQKKAFDNLMPIILEDIPASDYKIYFVQQCDFRDFNRGAIKNIGFLAMKNKYPNDYKNITFVFNDVDTIPRNKNLLDYNTEFGVIKHFYGHTNTLGGIVSIKGSDFEKTLGYPNFWAWGYEDNMLQIRAIQTGLTIDRSQFYKIGDPNILQLNETITRIVNRNEFNRYISNTQEGFSTIKNIIYDIDEINKFVHITNFDTGVENDKSKNQLYDLRNGNRPFNMNPLQSTQTRRRGSLMGLRI